MGKAGNLDSVDSQPRFGRRSTQVTVAAAALPTSSGCAPTIDTFGIFFPAWLVSTVVGLISAYVLVRMLSSRPGTRALAQSGLFFCSLTVTAALLFWWLSFSRF